MCCTTKQLRPRASAGWGRFCWWCCWWRWCWACGWPGAAPPTRSRAWPTPTTLNVLAKITARVAELKVREGDRVQAGQVLFLLDSPEVGSQGTAGARRTGCGAGGGRQGQRRRTQRGHPRRRSQLEARRSRCHPRRRHLSPRAEPVQRRGDDAAEARRSRRPGHQLTRTGPRRPRPVRHGIDRCARTGQACRAGPGAAGPGRGGGSQRRAR